ncbi:MAG: zinc ribbon domain-containing protein [Pyrinomonadaceae bacterium]
MPIYEYKCTDCGVRIEKMRKVTDEPLTVCESCGGKLDLKFYFITLNLDLKTNFTV